MYIAYNLVLLVVFILLVLPFFAYRALKEEGFAKRMRQSMGFFTTEEIAVVAEKNCIWIHGASVGEIVATSPLVKEIRKAYPQVPILVSAVTTGGYSMAKQIIPEATKVIYFPLDLYFIANWVVDRIKPRIFMPVETELWPNFLRVINNNDIPVMMVNGRISDKSVRQYTYLFKILEDMLNSVDRFCMQSEQDATHILKLGAEPSRVVVTGNTKFDQTYATVTEADKEKFLQELSVKGAYPVIVAGSTHPWEEEIVFQAFDELIKEYPTAKLIIAPRKTARISEISELARKHNHKVSLRKTLLTISQQQRPEHPVVLIDTIGELGRIYAIADIVFVGGSLIPLGGHNILEPAAHGCPILVGPHMFNFKDLHNLLNQHEACRMVRDARELTEQLILLSHNYEQRLQLGRNALKVIMQNRGAAKRTISYLQALLAGEAIHGKHLGYIINNATSSNITVEGGEGMRQREAIKLYLYRLIHGKRTHVWDYLLLALLRIMSWIYKFGVDAKLLLYTLGIFKRTRLDCVVISIGNITAGGTGKTPTAKKLAGGIRDKGYKIVILNRGYRSGLEAEVGVVSDGKKIYMRAQEAGDEAYLLAKNLPDVPIVIGADRAVSGEYVVKNMQPDVIILDDGYQHWKVARDLDIVLIDTTSMFGNNYLLPRGVLREPLSHLNRADIFLLTKVDQSSDAAKERIRDVLRKYNRKAAILESVHAPCYFVEIADWYKGVRSNKQDLDTLQGVPVMAFSAIGNPSSFEQTLSDIGADLVETIRYPDHHDYGMVELQYVVERASNQKVKALITTEKDAVKIPSEFIYSQREMPIYILGIEVKILEGKEVFEDIFEKAMKRKLARK